MFSLKFFSPIARTGTKERLKHRLTREQAAHDRAISRLHDRIRFLNGQLREHCEARAAVTAARVELDLDQDAVLREIEVAMIASPAPAQMLADEEPAVINMSDVLRFADARASDAEDRA